MWIFFDSTPSRMCGVIEPAKNNPAATYRNLVLCPNGASVGIGIYIPNSLYKLDVTGAINASTNIYEGGVLLSTKCALSTSLSNYVLSSSLSTTLSNYVLSSNLSSYALLASPTFTTQITTPKIILGSTDLQTTLDSKISNLSIGTVSSLSYGSVPSVTIDNTNPLIPKLNFNIITGEKGDKGDQGDSSVATASAVASATSASVATTSAVASATSASASASAVSATSASESATLATSKVRHFTASDLPNREILNGQLNVKDSLGISTVISLTQSGDISTSNSISVNRSGSSNVFIATSDGNVTTTGRISLDNGRIITGKNAVNINTINIGTNLVDGANLVNIGNGLSQVVIYGTLIYSSGNNMFNVSQFINQFS